jgi:hypothetical protein
LEQSIPFSRLNTTPGLKTLAYKNMAGFKFFINAWTYTQFMFTERSYKDSMFTGFEDTATSMESN